MKHRFLFALSSASLFSAAAATAVSCKTNTITQNNDENFDSFTTAALTPSGLDLDGPDHAHLTAPPNAVTDTVTVTIGKLHGFGAHVPQLPAGWVPSGGLYAFEPHNQGFAKDVAIRVPYTVPATGAGVRLVTAEPDGEWTPVDGAVMGTVDGVPGVFSSLQSQHFSYFTVVTGAPPDPTLHDAGPDATIPDAAPDATPDAPEAEAAPPPAPMAFLATQNGTFFRFGLTPPVIVPAPDAGAADAGADAGVDGGVDGAVDAEAGPPPGPTVDGGTIEDGGFWTLPANGASLAMSGAPYTLYAGFDTLFLGAPFDGGPAPEAGVLGFSDPFGTPTIALGIAVPAPGAMTAIGKDLWVSVGNPPDVEIFANDGTKVWPQQGSVITNGAPFGGMAYDPASSTLFLSTQSPDAVQRWTVSSAGASSQAIKAASITTNLNMPVSVTVTPWGELLVVNTGDNSVARFDLQGNYKSSYTFAMLQSTFGPIAAHRWPNGVDEIFVADGEQSQLKRFVFLDATHDSAAPAGSIPLGGAGTTITSLIVSP